MDCFEVVEPKCEGCSYMRYYVDVINKEETIYCGMVEELSDCNTEIKEAPVYNAPNLCPANRA